MGSIPFCQFQFHSIPFGQFQFHIKFINSNSIPIPNLSIPIPIPFFTLFLSRPYYFVKCWCGMPECAYSSAQQGSDPMFTFTTLLGTKPLTYGKFTKYLKWSVLCFIGSRPHMKIVSLIQCGSHSPNSMWKLINQLNVDIVTWIQRGNLHSDSTFK